MLAVPVLALVAAGAAGCTIESGTNEGKISKTASSYLRALAKGDSARACGQLTASRRRGDGYPDVAISNRSWSGHGASSL